jgi:pimeloyl-ACP methyl ester carboxylesterase
MKPILLIPGLGTDRRIFEQLIPLLNSNDVRCIEYHDPENVQCSIKEYAQQVVAKLPEGTTNPVLIGMSLGGTVATELSFLIPYQKLVLVSTFKHRSECPFLFKLARILPIYRWVPAIFIRTTVPFFARLLGICTQESAKQLKQMLQAKSARHFAWGRRAIVEWDNVKMPQNYIHINGSKDHIFGKSNLFATHVIKGGTHNMVVDRAQEIASIINREVLD